MMNMLNFKTLQFICFLLGLSVGLSLINCVISLAGCVNAQVYACETNVDASGQVIGETVGDAFGKLHPLASKDANENLLEDEHEAPQEEIIDERTTDVVETIQGEVLIESDVTTETPSSCIIYRGKSIEFIDAYFANVPIDKAGLWTGNDSTNDGGFAFFIGHNPGAFDFVVGLSIGDEITVYDRFGVSRAYMVVSAFDVPETTYWDIDNKCLYDIDTDTSYDVTAYGESIVLQTCNESGYRFVIASAGYREEPVCWSSGQPS